MQSGFLGAVRRFGMRNAVDLKKRVGVDTWQGKQRRGAAGSTHLVQKFLGWAFHTEPHVMGSSVLHKRCRVMRRWPLLRGSQLVNLVEQCVYGVLITLQLSM